jgi:anti-sigma B factor antagonist
MSDNAKFNIKIEENDGLNFLYLSGYLDAHTAPKLEDKISDIINTGNYDIIVNFSGLEYISSAGLGVFMAFIEEIRDKNGDIKLTEMNEKVFSVFDLLGFPMLFDIEKTDQEAADKFKSGNRRTNA